ncbi:MAG: NAD-dependent epimerase/dehydratase family protein [Streptomyces sp.]|nr:NAD-dependent epimerase/dehydratase family protein [Streptomyces sp.]NUS23669.1 NAD-dependent epimerase/dehydratase family protein [Streptomyces sp.]NUS76397.1 NAD-dependent epimerase/dehydratase family protein [Streptomyces sp.]
MAERVLITGGAGFIGLHLTRRLLAEGARITLVDDFSRGRRDDALRDIEGEVEVVRHDLTRQIPDGLLPGDFDAVYHLAAAVGVQQVTRDPGHVLRTNILAATHLLDWCDRTGPGAVFLSSTSEFADGAAQLGAAPLPTPENAPFVLTRPHSARSSYALSKAVAELMLLQRASSTRVRIGRYYNIYGPRMGNAHVIPQFIERVVKGVHPFTVYGGDQTRAFCYVDDAVDATVRLMRLPTDAPLVVNIGNDQEELAMTELARRLLALAGARPELDVRDAPENSPARRLPDLTTLRRLLPDWRPMDLDSGLRAMLDWYGAPLATPSPEASR